MAVCPVYLVQRREQGVARGKLALIKECREGRQRLNRRYRKEITACLLCGSCTQSCPNQVDTISIVQAARSELACKNKTSWLKRMLLGRLLPSKRIWPLLMRGIRTSRLIWAKRIPEESGLHLRLFRDKSGRRRKMPALSNPFYLERKTTGNRHTKGKIAGVFAGCLGNYMRPQAVDGVVEFLKKHGYSPQVPKDQTCCGLAAFGLGENQAARKLAERNINAFLAPGQPWPEFITTPCASCAYMLKTNLPELVSGDPVMQDRARELALRVVPFSRLWSKVCGSTRRPAGCGSDQRSPLLTYHDPCHLARGFGEKDAPRHLLQSLEGVGFVEMDHPCKCCGHGGCFNISHYDLSSQIAKKKIESILSSGANIVVTECAGCLLQLLDMMNPSRPDVEVITTSEALHRFGTGNDGVV